MKKRKPAGKKTRIKKVPDHHDAELVLKLYDLRREAVMRQSRDALMRFLPRTYEELAAVIKLDHPQNAAWRQVSSYFEMAYGFARHGVVNPDILVEATGEGLFLFAKVAPHLERFRRESSPYAFANAQWLVENCPLAKQRFQLVQARVAKLLAP